jgi:hypothetical protein
MAALHDLLDRVGRSRPVLNNGTIEYLPRVDFGFIEDADRLDAAAFNRILWLGIMGNVPYPTVRNGLDLRKNRAPLLAVSKVCRQRRCMTAKVYSAKKNNRV